MIEALKKNVDTEIDILREIAVYNSRLDSSNELEKKQINATIASLKNSLKIINNSIPDLLKNVDTPNKLPVKKDVPSLEQVKFTRTNSSVLDIALPIKDKEKFLRELSISENLIKRMKIKEVRKEEKFDEFKAARGYLKLSNKLFLDKSQELIKKGYFNALTVEIKKANLDVLLDGYVAMMFFTTLISVFVGIIIGIFFIFFSLSWDFPFIVVFHGNYLIRIIIAILIPILIPILTFFALYIYPSTEKDTLSKRIEGELPFAVIHMSAISGSGISPSEIFKIIGLSKEYPYLRREIRKVLNQINIYGYDLVTALGNVSRNTPSQRLSELFNGIATTISSGGDLSEFFEKRAETLLLSYRLEREKFTRIAETFMDIYISVVIATPMILMLLLVMVSLTGFDTGFSPTVLNLLIIGAIALINILFLAFLQIKQPTY